MATTSTSNIERARELMRRSRREHFAVGAFNVDNQETLLAIVRAAQAKRAPVLVEVSHGEVAMIGLANLRSMVDNYRAEYGVEMYINLDHSPSVEAAKAGIDAGFEFIHIDYSQANQRRHRRRDHRGHPGGRRLRPADDRRAGRERAALLRRQLQRPHRGRSTTTRSARRSPRPKAPRRSSPRPGSTPSPPPSATCTAATRSRSSSTSNCCNESATPSTATSACTAAAARPATTSRRPRGSASARSTSTPICATPTAPRSKRSSSQPGRVRGRPAHRTGDRRRTAGR